jgi:hypothetical protein
MPHVMLNLRYEHGTPYGSSASHTALPYGYATGKLLLAETAKRIAKVTYSAIASEWIAKATYSAIASERITKAAKTAPRSSYPA